MLCEINQQISNRIFDTTVLNVYSAWKKRGLLEETGQVLSTLSDEDAKIVAHTFAIHVHKEKGLFLDLLGEQIGIPSNQRKAIAASADLLWALSLMIDDIEDHDVTRGNEASSWIKYGPQATITAAHACLYSVVQHLAATTEQPLIGKSCLCYVRLGLESLALHRQMDLDTSSGEIFRNYEQRCDFHGTFQLVSFGLLGDGQAKKVAPYIAGLRAFNRAGQLINDLKDIAQGDLYHRSYSDIRNGVPTVPLVDMYQTVRSNSARFLKSIFKQNPLTYDQRNRLQEVVTESTVVSRTLRRIDWAYEQAIDLISPQLDNHGLEYLQAWAQYKSDTIHRQLET